MTSLAAQAAAVAAVLPTDDHVPNVLLGLAIGGAVAACTAVRHGPRVHALELLAAALDPLVPVANAPFMQRHLQGAAPVVTELLHGHDHFLPWNAAAPVRRVVTAAAVAAC